MNTVFDNTVMNPLQQQQQRWMERPPGDSSPLAHLKPLQSLIAKQSVSMSEVILGIPANAKFGIYNDQGEQVYFAFEESDCCERMMCSSTRGFTLHVVDRTNQELIRIIREFKCCAGCCWTACCSACSQEVTVESPPGTIIGSVGQECSCWRMHYTLKNETDTPVMTVLGPTCICDGPYACCCENKFTIFGSDGSTEIGAIHKKYRGFFAEALTAADTFTIQIPRDLEVRMKAVSLGALFLIDLSNFAHNPQQH